MPRPVKRRRVCEPPRNARFGPLDGAPAESVVLTVDEYETIRLIDLLGLTQEECAGQMGVARTTVQALYEAARAKLADMLVNGRLLHVEGGPYELCPRAGRGQAACHRARAARLRAWNHIGGFKHEDRRHLKTAGIPHTQQLLHRRTRSLQRGRGHSQAPAAARTHGVTRHPAADGGVAQHVEALR